MGFFDNFGKGANAAADAYLKNNGNIKKGANDVFNNLKNDKNDESSENNKKKQ